MNRIVYTSLLSAALFFAACSSKTSNEAPPAAEEHDPTLVEFTEEQYKTADVQLGSVTDANLSNYIKASGSIDVPPKDMISITSPYGGTLRFTDVIEGKYIRQGQLLATIENPEFVQVQQDYLESNSQLTYLKQTLDRQEELVKENIAARKSLQQAQSEYSSMQARVEGLKAKLRIFNINAATLKPGNLTSRANIYAPSDGYITHVYSNVGKYIGSNELLADMANTDHILVKAKVFEKDLPQIRMGQRVRFRATGDSVERMAEVFLVGKDIDTDRTVEVHARILNRSANLLPGMFINAIMEVGSSSSPAVPQSAVVQNGGKNYIFVVTDHRNIKASADAPEEGKHYAFKRVEVGTGVTENSLTSITLPKNFDRKSQIVVRGAYDLLSKMNNAGDED